MIRPIFPAKKSSIFWMALVAVIFNSGCTESDSQRIQHATNSAEDIQTMFVNSDWDWQTYLPQGFPEPFVPIDNPMSEAKFQLGRHLFYDKRLSGNATQACASCHFQHLAFTDGRAKPVGSTGDQISRSSQSLVNVSYYASLTWANPAISSLERQALVPLLVDNVGVEMGINDQNKQQVLQRLKQDAFYARHFTEVFAEYSDPINLDTVVKLLATFQRGLISAESKFDRVQRGEAVYSATELRGHNLFYGKAQCAKCHSGFNFSNHTFHAQTKRIKRSFHNTGLYNLDDKGQYPDHQQGLLEVMPQRNNMGKFRVPTLRNIALTAPYMHDGSMQTLVEVVAHYAAGGRNIEQGEFRGDGRSNPFKDPLLNNIQLNSDEQHDLVTFLQTLTDNILVTNPRFSNPFLTGNNSDIEVLRLSKEL